MEDFDEMYRSRLSAYKRILGELRFKELKSSFFGFTKDPEESVMFPIFDDICGLSEVEEVQNDFLMEWKMSGINGTDFHKDREEETKAAGGKINPFTGNWCNHIDFKKDFDNQTISLDFSTLEPGMYTEFLAFDKSIELSRTLVGTIDELFIEIDKKSGRKVAYTDDFKTNGSAPKVYKNKKCKPPISHLYENKVTSYELQSSLYLHLLSTHGLEIGAGAYTHYTDYDPSTGKMKKCQFLEKEIIDMKKFSGYV